VESELPGAPQVEERIANKVGDYKNIDVTGRPVRPLGVNTYP
jgi:hypothetical protein